MAGHVSKVHAQPGRKSAQESGAGKTASVAINSAGGFIIRKSGKHEGCEKTDY